MKKIEKIILTCIFSAVPLMVIILGIYYVFFSPSPREIKTKNDLAENFHGKVDSIYEDKPNHDEWYAIIKNKYSFNLPPGWQSQINVGDSLSKKKGSFLLEVYKSDGRKVILDFKSTLPPPR